MTQEVAGLSYLNPFKPQTNANSKVAMVLKYPNCTEVCDMGLQVQDELKRAPKLSLNRKRIYKRPKTLKP